MAAENACPSPVPIVTKAVEEFCQRWLSGLNPSLHLETAPDGEVRVRCQVHAGGAHRAVERQWQVGYDRIDVLRNRNRNRIFKVEFLFLLTGTGILKSQSGSG